MSITWNERHAIAWVADHAADEPYERAVQYAAWYETNYPEGNKSHADTYWYWLTNVGRIKRD